MATNVQQSFPNSAPCRTVEDFLDLSVLLTGYERTELESIGLARTYHDELLRIIGESLASELLGLVRHRGDHPRTPSDRNPSQADTARAILESPRWGPVARNIMQMWYLGQWTQLPRAWRNEYGANPYDTDRVISAAAYQEGLLWGDAGTHPPGAKQPGFGSWALPPRVFGETATASSDPRRTAKET